MPDTLSVDVLRTGPQLEAFRPEWVELFARDPQATPFQSPEWLLPWWHQFGTSDLRVAAVRRAGELVTLLPMYVFDEPATGERKLMPLGVGTSDYLDGLFAAGSTREDVDAGWNALCGESGWDTLYCSQLRACSPWLEALGRRGACPSAGESTSRMAAVRIAELPPKIRRNAMYYRNRALRLGQLELVTAGEADCLEAFADLVRLHTASWQTRGQSGVLADPRVLDWHREASPLLARAGRLRLCTLRLNADPIAVLYSLVDPPGQAERTQYFYLTAFAPEHAELRPGTLLLAYAIEQAAEEGVATIDMLRGDETYKAIWHLERMPTYGFALRNPLPAEGSSLGSAA